MAVWECDVCGYEYDERTEGTDWEDLPDDWDCPICGATKSQFSTTTQTVAESGAKTGEDSYLQEWSKSSDDSESFMTMIHRIAETGQSQLEPMGSKVGRISWDKILIKGAQLARLPLNPDEPVNTSTIIGPKARKPLLLDIPIYISHMSFGALSREVKLALAEGSAASGTAMCSGEGGVLPESLERSHRYIFEYVPNLYSVTDELLQQVDAEASQDLQIEMDHV